MPILLLLAVLAAIAVAAITLVELLEGLGLLAFLPNVNSNGRGTGKLLATGSGLASGCDDKSTKIPSNNPKIPPSGGRTCSTR